MNALPLEVLLLLACARLYIDARQATRIKDWVSKNVDWAYLLSVARSHQVMPLLYKALNSTCPDAVPIAILEELRERSLCKRRPEPIFSKRIAERPSDL